MPEREISFYIVDVLIAINKIQRYSDRFENANDFFHSELEWDATIRELQLIGDATNVILNNNLIDPSYRRIVDFRNQLVHAYFGIDETIVWEVITEKLNVYGNDLLFSIKENKIDLSLAIDSAIAENKHNKEVKDLLKTI